MFYLMRGNGYTGRFKPFEVLIQAYVNAKVPAYGLRERMKADNLRPDKEFYRRIALLDGFRETENSYLLD